MYPSSWFWCLRWGTNHYISWMGVPDGKTHGLLESRLTSNLTTVLKILLQLPFNGSLDCQTAVINHTLPRKVKEEIKNFVLTTVVCMCWLLRVGPSNDEPTGFATTHLRWQKQTKLKSVNRSSKLWTSSIGSGSTPVLYLIILTLVAVGWRSSKSILADRVSSKSVPKV